MKKYFGIWFFFYATAMIFLFWQPLGADNSIYSKEVVAEGGFYQLSIPDPVVMPNARILAMKGSDIFAFHQDGSPELVISLGDFSLCTFESNGEQFFLVWGWNPYSARGIYTSDLYGNVSILNNTSFDAPIALRVGTMGFGQYEGDVFVVENGNADVPYADFGAVDGIIRITPDGTKYQFYNGNTADLLMYDARDLAFSPPDFGEFGNLLFVIDSNKDYPYLDNHRIVIIRPDQSAEIFFDLNSLEDSSTFMALDFNPISPELWVASRNNIYKITPAGNSQWIDGGYTEIRDIRFNNQGELFVTDYSDQLLYKILPVPPVISCQVTIQPERLNLKSKGRWVTAYITLPEGHNVNDIDVDTLKLLVNKTELPAVWGNVQDNLYMAKFDRSQLISLLTGTIGTVGLTVTGKVADRRFTGTDEIKVH